MLKILKKILLPKRHEIEKWISSHSHSSTLPIYSSVDIRNSNIKAAPVDTNVFPAGFNNLSMLSKKKARENLSQFFKVENICIDRIGIFVELFTRNIKYWANILALYKILLNNDNEVRILIDGSKDDLDTIKSLTDLDVCQVASNTRQVTTLDGWNPSIVILNNDLTGECPNYFANTETLVLPSIKLGWFKRTKYDHLLAYQKVLSNFCKTFKIDPWLLSTYFDICENICFRKKIGLDILADKVDRLINMINCKYQEYDNKNPPYVFLKSNHGSFGRGIICVKNASELKNLNRKHRNTMHTIKNNISNTNIVLQEGIPTTMTYHNFSAEKVIYLIQCRVIGGFTRFNTMKNKFNNLNSNGMEFSEDYQDSFIEDLLARLATMSVSFEQTNE